MKVPVCDFNCTGGEKKARWGHNIPLCELIVFVFAFAFETTVTIYSYLFFFFCGEGTILQYQVVAQKSELN